MKRFVGTNRRRHRAKITDLEQTDAEKQISHCKDPLDATKSNGSPATGLAFTHDWLAPFLDSARSNFFLGEVSEECGQEAASESYGRAAQADGASDIVWAWA